MGKHLKKRTVQSRLLTKAQFIEKARAAHGLLYDYSETIYLPAPQKIAIRCLEHGVFMQQACMHSRGMGCPKCGKVRSSQNLVNGQNRTPTEVFLEKAQAKNPSLNFSKFIYTGSGKRGVVICPKHGEFTSTPHRILFYASPCRFCSYESRTWGRLPLKQWIERFISMHGEKYGYSLIRKEKNGEDKVSIICPIHGVFRQAIAQHAIGSGCPGCADERKSAGWLARAQAAGHIATLYLLRIYGNGETFFKVGVTYRGVENRFKPPRSLAGYAFEVLATHRSPNTERVYGWEQSIIHTFRRFRYRPKKHFIGATECFSSADEILEIFPL